MPQSPSLASLSARLTTCQSQLLERSRVLSLGMVPSASTTTQLVRTLANVKKDLDKLSDEAELERAGLIVGGSKAKASGSNIDADEQALEELGNRYDRLVEMLAKDEDGRERAQPLMRPKREASPELEAEVEVEEEREMSDLQPPSPIGSPSPAAQPLRPFRDYDDDEGGPDEHGMMAQQHELMNDQDERLNLLSHSINRQQHMSVQIGDELDRHHELLEETDAAMDRTAASLGRAKRRLDTVAEGARQHGSTLTIVALIVILLFLIIIFKT